MNSSEVVVYGQGLGKSTGLNALTKARFKVIEAFKGDLKAGDVIEVNTYNEYGCHGPSGAAEKYVLYLHSLEKPSVRYCDAFLMERKTGNGGYVYGATEQEAKQKLVAIREVIDTPLPDCDSIDQEPEKFAEKIAKEFDYYVNHADYVTEELSNMVKVKPLKIELPSLARAVTLDMYFTRIGHPAHPSVLKRKISNRDGNYAILMSGDSASQPRQFKSWVKTFDGYYQEKCKTK